MKKVSVIIPCYNGQDLVGRCLRSISDQSMARTEYEVIVIDDGSTDSTQFVLDIFRDNKKFIKILKNEKNLGLPASLNKGISEAESEYIVRLDADDYVNHLYLDVLYTAVIENSWDACSCDYYTVDEWENFLERKNAMEEPIGCGIIFKKNKLIDVGMYDESFELCEEVEFRRRFEQKYKIEHIPIPLYRYRRHADNITNNVDKMETFMARATLKNL